MQISKKLMMPVLALTVSAALFSSTIVNAGATAVAKTCLLYTSPSPRDS